MSTRRVYIGPFVEVEVEGANFDVQDVLASDAFMQPLAEQEAKDCIKTFIPTAHKDYSAFVEPEQAKSFKTDIVEVATADFKRDYEKDLKVLGEYVRSIKVRWGVVSYL